MSNSKWKKLDPSTSSSHPPHLLLMCFCVSDIWFPPSRSCSLLSRDALGKFLGWRGRDDPNAIREEDTVCLPLVQKLKGTCTVTILASAIDSLECFNYNSCVQVLPPCRWVWLVKYFLRLGYTVFVQHRALCGPGNKLQQVTLHDRTLLTFRSLHPGWKW